MVFSLSRRLAQVAVKAGGCEAWRMAQAQLAALVAGRQKREAARKAAEAAKAAKAAKAQVAARVDATPVPPPAPERRRPILTLASLRVGGHATVG